MKILIFGDIFGRIGRGAMKSRISELKSKYSPDFIIANCENLTSGRGPIEKHILEMEKIGIDIFTSGNHIWDNEKSIRDYISSENSPILRPANYFESDFYSIPGKGYKIFEKNNKKLLVINLLSGVFGRDQVYNPFLKADEIIKKYDSEDLDGIIIDFHREATSETKGLACFLDSRASFVYGTHTHVQTNDDLILPGGTATITDIGMIGSIYSVIGATYDSLKRRFITGINKGKIEQDLGNEYVINGVFIEISDDMKCKNIEKIKLKGTL